MEITIQIKVRKDLNPREQKGVIKLKGSLISRGYTQIIHIGDQDDEFHINTFETCSSQRAEVEQYIVSFADNADLVNTIFLKS